MQNPTPDPLQPLRSGTLGWLVTLEALYQRFLYEAEELDNPTLRQAFLAVEEPRLDWRRRRALLYLDNSTTGTAWQIPASRPPDGPLEPRRPPARAQPPRHP